MGTNTSHPPRWSDRISIVIQIQIFGADIEGRTYCEEARTLEVSRNGALILANRQLIPEAEIMIRRERTGKESPARIVGLLREEPDGFVYAVRLLDPNINLWDINFVPWNEGVRAVKRILLECAKCRLREEIYLEEFEAEVYYANRFIYHPCTRCRESTIWKETKFEPTNQEQVRAIPPPGPPSEPVPAPQFINTRRHKRIRCNFQACIRGQQNYDEEVLQVKDVSRGGICFMTRKYIPPGTRIDIAAPYSRDTMNIFVPAEVVRIRTISDNTPYECGAAYLKSA
jgi:hypothetical protein